VNTPRYCYLEEYSSLVNKIAYRKVSFVLTQSNMLLVARSALNLYECAVSTSNADFRLYEFLKNSRIDPGIRSQQQSSLLRNRFGVDLIRYIGGG
jgi:hypothetical protein